MFESFNIPHTGRARIKAIRSGLPVRMTNGGSKSVKVRYCSTKMGFVLDLEASHTEYAAAVTWEYDDDTFEYYPQPTKLLIRWRDKKGTSRAYYSTPDFFRISRKGFQFVECKLEEDLHELAQKHATRYSVDANGNWRSPPAEAAAAELGCEFVLRSSTQNNWTLIENYEFLRDYLIVRSNIDAAELNRLREILTERAWISIDELLHSEKINPDTLYAAITQNEVYFDLTRDRLTDVESSGVFRDHDASVAYRLFVNSRADDRFSCASLSLQPGARFQWDGQPWEVLNTGDRAIAARSLNSAPKLGPSIIELPHEHVSGLARAGKIVPTRTTDVSLTNVWCDLSRYSAEELQIAVWRYQVLFGSPEKDNPLQSRSIRAQKYWLAEWKKCELTKGYGFIGLFSNPDKTQGNKQRKLDPAVINLMHEIIDTDWPDPRQATLTSLYGTLMSRCEENGLTVPRRKTFIKELNRRNDIGKLKERLGARMAYEEESIQHWWIEQTTPVHGTHAFHIAHIDSTPLDLKLLDKSLSRVVKSLWLTLLIDAFTRKILAFYLTFDKPSYRSNMMVIRDCVRRHGRLPQFIVSDQGPEFGSVYYETLLARFKSNKKERPASRPRSGSPIERVFNTTQEAFIYNLLGNTQAEKNWRKVSSSVNPTKFAIWTYERIHTRLDQYFDNVYHNNFHTTLGCTPQQKYLESIEQSGLRSHVFIPYDRDFLIMTMPGTKKGDATVTNRGVKILYRYHTSPVLASLSLRGKSLPVRYDPYDLGTAMVYVNGRWEEVISEYHSIFKSHTERQIIIASEFLRLRDREAGKKSEMTAQRLAEFLMSTKADEVLDLQRLHDGEAQVVRKASAAPLDASSIDQDIRNDKKDSAANAELKKKYVPKILESFDEE
ncbi:Mu transposase C-terminal domain-containing protein [Noviherbaspirillum agri]